MFCLDFDLICFKNQIIINLTRFIDKSVKKVPIKNEHHNCSDTIS